MPVSEPSPSNDAIISGLYAGLIRFAAVVAPRGQDPDDLVHDALVRTITRHALADLEFPQAYLHRAILNLANNRRRSLTRQLASLGRLRPQAATEDDYPSDVTALLDLAPETRAVLWLADVEGLPFVEIAAQLGLTSGAARQRASRGRAELRERLSRGEFGDAVDIEGASP